MDWERLPDLKSSSQQRNVVLHPEFVDGKYAFYTRPQDGFIDTGNGGGIGWALIDDITHAEITEESIINRRYTTRLRRRKTAKAPTRSKHPGDGCTWRTACEPAPLGCVMCSTST